MFMKRPIFFKPVLQERIWGGQKLAQFGYELPSNQTGECWGISAHQNGLSIVREGEFEGKSLRELWDSRPELFGGETSGGFPLLVKILDAAADLSVQVHPNDEQAAALEKNEAYGKTECWYVIDAEEGAELILGHTAQTVEDFTQKVNQNDWETLLNRVPIKAGDFFHVPSGTIHAIGAGTIILETQQSSDTTYRVYDFERTDDSGKKRELHLEKAMQVTQIPDIRYKTETLSLTDNEGCKVTELVTTNEFTVYHGQVNSYWNAAFDAKYLLLSIVQGTGELTIANASYRVVKGDHLLLPVDATTFEVKGELELIVSHT